MTQHEPPDEPTRVDVPVTDPTMAMPVAPAGAPPPGPPPVTGRPPEEPDRRGWVLAALLVAVVLVGLAVLLLADDGDDDEATLDSTTTSTSTTVEDTTSSTSTTEAPTTTEATTTTEAGSPATVAPGLCRSGAPDDPDTSVQVAYQAFVLGDRECADQLGTEEAIDDLFAIPGDGGGWEYQGCSEQDEPDPHLDCAFTFPGGATHLKTRYSGTDGWVIFEVLQTTD